ncbi:hypothetical protein L596_023592 [Steinernema carpocapsae]|uniref:Cullin neddylation domain-containing protein n=1 Tax=Steinernema carpocapsae TaxID=34508 RepID=A0A4U5ME41_STECR|nr:hypothetical protein L596_023592 [Steinernema carpocapsae]
MVVLLKYNDATSLSFALLASELAMPEDVLLPVLASFVKADLFRLPEGVKIDSISNETQFTLNGKFSSKRIKLDLLKVYQSATSEVIAKKENDKMKETVNEDRKLYLQAAIVRVMKMRRSLQHTALLTEVMDQVKARFPPNIKLIKECVDILIEKEYIKRSEEKKNFYEYIS